MKNGFTILINNAVMVQKSYWYDVTCAVCHVCKPVAVMWTHIYATINISVSSFFANLTEWMENVESGLTFCCVIT